ncbi:MAG: DUF2147 domain-containing protein [Bacteroidetes bacterium HGW-Bacteroidetes-21]|jgi:uncharacterized protein (DUF2147 family)|nr:MAG: DUF2147 domain-containing protein [Bacteroidetes bacterium HGW-Bacteroidetes-21]
MKRFGILFLFLLPFIVDGQTKASDCTGKWITEEGKSVVEIYEQNGQYFGKIIWIKNPLNKDGKPLIDNKNPDLSQRGKEIKGLVFMKNFTFDGKNMWKDGNLYDPESGNTYSGYLKLKSQDILELRGYMGVSMLGRTSTWVRKK